jgi:hypothetical protein
MNEIAAVPYFVVHPVAAGAFSGFVGAVLIDLAAFKRWQRWQDACVYDWSVATMRWTQGLVGGALGALGLGAIL